MTKVKKDEVKGYQIDLSDNRYVFAGTYLDHPDTFCIEFCNKDKELTLISLSSEAAEALQEALSNLINGQPVLKLVVTPKKKK